MEETEVPVEKMVPVVLETEMVEQQIRMEVLLPSVFLERVRNL